MEQQLSGGGDYDDGGNTASGNGEIIMMETVGIKYYSFQDRV